LVLPPAFLAFAKIKWPMKTRREEEAIIADGPQEQGSGWRRWDFRCSGRNRADAGAQINGIQGFARVAVPQLKRAVFAGEGREIGLLRHQVKVYRSSQFQY
jgi:hypothetical protein